MDIIVTITEQEFEILESWLGVGEVQKWLQHALDNKIRQRMDATILEHTNFNPKKMTSIQKMDEVKKISLPTREERDSLPLKVK